VRHPDFKEIYGCQTENMGRIFSPSFTALILHGRLLCFIVSYYPVTSSCFLHFSLCTSLRLCTLSLINSDLRSDPQQDNYNQNSWCLQFYMLFRVNLLLISLLFLSSKIMQKSLSPMFVGSKPINVVKYLWSGSFT
jgi:hypothetical protein